MLPTPTYQYLSKSILKELVYEPSEDTFLFLDALELELEYLSKLKPLIALEIGSGSGVVITFLAKHLQTNNETEFFAIDINKNACLASKETSLENEICLNVIQSDLLFSLKPNSIDIILFNAPYVPSEENEIDCTNISAAWAGGNDGRKIMDRLFPLIPKILTNNGVFYLVCIKANKIHEIENIFLELNFKMDVVLNRRTSIENLFVLKFYRKI
jgi:release factor glutamine methyltransferase